MRLKAIKVFGGLALAALLLASAAAAHEGESPPGYESKVTSISPAMGGINAAVVEGDDEIELVNGTGKTVIIYGYNKEPYLRFDAKGVFENQRSPAAFLNDDRFGKSAVPKDATADAAPLWLRVAAGKSFSWHDHRIHWMSPIDPPTVKADKGKAHHIFDWKVQAAVAGEPLTIAGTLDYSPPPGGGVSTALVAAIAAGAAAVVGVAAVVLLRRRRSA
jgi:hypothetical protein